MKSAKFFSVLAIGLLSVASITAQAAVVNSADVNGLKTFTDTNTGRIWLDMDNFFDSATATGTMTGYDMIAAAQNAGFTVATTVDIHQLLDSLPLTNNEWSSYASVMGYGQPRQLIWGTYSDGNPLPTFSWAWAWASDQQWNYYDGVNSFMGTVINGPGETDLGLWAYKQDISQVPVPAAVWLFGSALTGLVGLRKRK